MSDFLERVLSAARGEEATLRPRGAGLFEPPAELADTGVAPRPARGPFAVDPHVGQRSGDPPPRREGRTAPGAPVTSPSRTARVLSRVPAPADEPAPAANAGLVPDAVAPVSARAVAPAAPAAPGLGARVGPRVRSVPAAAPVAAPGQEPGGAEARTAPSPPPEAVAPEGPGDPAAGGEPPVIRVTIGRVEVRASAPPAASPRRPPRAEPPPLGLAQYLRERREGRR